MSRTIRSNRDLVWGYTEERWADLMEDLNLSKFVLIISRAIYPLRAVMISNYSVESKIDETNISYMLSSFTRSIENYLSFYETESESSIYYLNYII